MWLWAGAAIENCVFKSLTSPELCCVNFNSSNLWSMSEESNKVCRKDVCYLSPHYFCLFGHFFIWLICLFSHISLLYLIQKHTIDLQLQEENNMNEYLGFYFWKCLINKLSSCFFRFPNISYTGTWRSSLIFFIFLLIPPTAFNPNFYGLSTTFNNHFKQES